MATAVLLETGRLWVQPIGYSTDVRRSELGLMGGFRSPYSMSLLCIVSRSAETLFVYSYVCVFL